MCQINYILIINFIIDKVRSEIKFLKAENKTITKVKKEIKDQISVKERFLKNDKTKEIKRKTELDEAAKTKVVSDKAQGLRKYVGDIEMKTKQTERAVDDQNDRFDCQIDNHDKKMVQIKCQMNGMYKERSVLNSKITQMHEDHKENMEKISDDEIKKLSKPPSIHSLT